MIVEEPQHWTAEHLAAAESADDGDTYDDWAITQLEAAVYEAAERFVADHPDLFRGEII